MSSPEQKDRSFGTRLHHAVAAHGPLCVGIDPHASLMDAWGLSVDVAGLRRFTELCVEAFAGHVAIVKPQVAFFERWGSAGFAVLEEALAAFRQAGTLTLADAKRGDIGSTMAGYAHAWCDPSSPLRADAVTISPYLGMESLTPFIDCALNNDTGVFILAATSNPQAATLQTARLGQSAHDGDSTRSPTVAQYIVDQCARYNGSTGVGSVGVVVGATVTEPPVLTELNGPVLLPGVGAQGGGIDDVRRIVPAGTALALAAASRSVLRVGPDPVGLREKAFDLADVLSTGPFDS